MRVITYPTRRTRRNHTLNNFFNTLAQPQSAYNAAVNVAENDDAFRIELAAPGRDKADFHIEIENDVLTVQANTDATESTKGETFVRKEFVTTEIKRTFNLPETVNATAITAEYLNGILTVKLPKKEEAKPQPARKVEIA